ncbi:Rieske (2Fe-2S) protein [Haloplanus aerogenes]|uniref:(2Fe-2S)-binding protein n=1 Tax=Haloplanus aerogenes TaxID=660522 RepID=A0A3M0CSW7_9EURY|nr:Rieske 2Fe-2S domain-containing protein [Haloplanus aerogenes]AZH26971.1 (2Fe-2S)-binding protein [Haloplanus aerogenes]RMB12624.1 nitrite reductase/ring-hydroxylating ferredoxin subunit [Haloplanus aerogenes]
MDESVRVTLEDGDESDVVRIRGTADEVTVGDATFRFDIGGPDAEQGEPDGGIVVDGAADADAEVEPEPKADENDRRYVAPADAVPDRGTLRFEATAGRRRVDGILQRLDDEGIVAWENSCPHKPEVQLDRGLGALIDGDQLVCHEHGARFNCDDGYCTRGPCRGRSLSPIDVTVRDGDVFLTDDRFEAGQRLD